MPEYCSEMCAYIAYEEVLADENGAPLAPSRMVVLCHGGSYAEVVYAARALAQNSRMVLTVQFFELLSSYYGDYKRIWLDYCASHPLAAEVWQAAQEAQAVYSEQLRQEEQRRFLYAEREEEEATASHDRMAEQATAYLVAWLRQHDEKLARLQEALAEAASGYYYSRASVLLDELRHMSHDFTRTLLSYADMEALAEEIQL